MKTTTLIVIFLLPLITALNVKEAAAHDGTYVCNGFCKYGKIIANKRVPLTTEDVDEQIAFNDLKLECDKLDGNLLAIAPLGSSSNIQDYCHIEWH